MDATTRRSPSGIQSDAIGPTVRVRIAPKHAALSLDTVFRPREGTCLSFWLINRRSPPDSRAQIYGQHSVTRSYLWIRPSSQYNLAPTARKHTLTRAVTTVLFVCEPYHCWLHATGSTAKQRRLDLGDIVPVKVILINPFGGPHSRQRQTAIRPLDELLSEGCFCHYQPSDVAGAGKIALASRGYIQPRPPTTSRLSNPSIENRKLYRLTKEGLPSKPERRKRRPQRNGTNTFRRQHKCGWESPSMLYTGDFQMLRGRQFVLRKDTVALLLDDGKREIVHIPCGAVITLLCEYADKHGTVGVFWDGRIYWMFLADIEERGEFFADGATA